MHMRKKPGVVARARAKKRRQEGPVVKKVREKCVERDGICRLMGVGPCEGYPEWCHLGEQQRFKTRGLAPEVRHTTAGSFIGCSRHHRLYDAGVIEIEALDAEKGADGTLRVRDKSLLVCV